MRSCAARALQCTREAGHFLRSQAGIHMETDMDCGIKVKALALHIMLKFGLSIVDG